MKFCSNCLNLLSKRAVNNGICICAKCNGVFRKNEKFLIKKVETELILLLRQKMIYERMSLPRSERLALVIEENGKNVLYYRKPLAELSA